MEGCSFCPDPLTNMAAIGIILVSYWSISKILLLWNCLAKWTTIWWVAPMEGLVLSFLKAEWKVSDTGSAHWASSLVFCWCFWVLPHNHKYLIDVMLLLARFETIMKWKRYYAWLVTERMYIYSQVVMHIIDVQSA
jgi:hypothetical protein